MRTFLVVSLLFLVACGITGRITDPTLDLYPDPLELGDFEFLMGARPVVRTEDFPTCSYPDVEWVPDFFLAPVTLTCPDHHTPNYDLQFWPGSTVVYVGPMRAFTHADSPPCSEFSFSVASAQASLNLTLHPDSQGVVPSNERALLEEYLWDSGSNRLQFSHLGPGSASDCYAVLRYRLAVGHLFDEVFPSVADGVVPVGRISDYVSNSTLYQWGRQNLPVDVVSGGKVLVGFSSSDPGSVTSTTDYSDVLYACLDADETGVCDSAESAADNCLSLGGDYFAGFCCGLATPLGYKGFIDDNYMLCANTSAGPRFVSAVLDKGEIFHHFGAPGYDFVPTGNAFRVCGEHNFDVGYSVVVDDHEFLCADDGVFECGGDAPFNSYHGLSTGDFVDASNITYYCASNASFTTDVVLSESSCTSLGHEWTGTRCCGIGEDYVDFDSQATGVCLGDEVLDDGELLLNDSLLVYSGGLFSCDSVTDYQGLPVTPHSACGVFLADAFDGKSAVCSPQGIWVFRDTDEYQFEKSVPFALEPGEFASGCCDADQCWDGSSCMDKGDFVNRGGGFECR